MSPSPHHTLAEVSKTFGLSERALRYYDYIELVQPKAEGGKRLYGRRELARLKLILRGRRFGMRLEELRVWLNLYDQYDEDTQSRAWLEIAQRKEAELVSRIEALQSALGELREISGAVHAQLEPVPPQAEDAAKAAGH